MIIPYKDLLFLLNIEKRIAIEGILTVEFSGDFLLCFLIGSL